MRLIDLLDTIDAEESEQYIQVCRSGEDWENYDTIIAYSPLLKPFYNLKIKSLSAIREDVFRVDLDFYEKKGGGTE